MDGGAKDQETLPPGFRFHPTDEELIAYYLTNKISDPNFTGRAIGDVDLNKSEPWDLPGKAKMGEKEWYFFCLRDRKYPTGMRANRATNSGYWKTTGKDREIFNSVTTELVGMKKTLVFYRGRAPRGEKTNWVMHEYRIHSKTTFRSTKDEWVVCRIFQKSSGAKKYPSSNQSRSSANPYALDIGHHNLVPPPPMPLLGGDTCHFPIGRNYVNSADLAEVSRVLRGSPSGMQSQQMSYPGCFTISGLNLNLSAPTQPVLRAMQPQHNLILNQQMMASSASMVTPNHHVLNLTENGCAADMNGGGGGGGGGGSNSFSHMEPGVDLETYWAPY